jgi:ACR3 family arsenite efflux pump ArsB
MCAKISDYIVKKRGPENEEKDVIEKLDFWSILKLSVIINIIFI